MEGLGIDNKTVRVRGLAPKTLTRESALLTNKTLCADNGRFQCLYHGYLYLESMTFVSTKRTFARISMDYAAFVQLPERSGYDLMF